MIVPIRMRLYVSVVGLVVFAGQTATSAETATPVNVMHVDASAAGAPPIPTSFRGGAKTNPQGDVLSMNSRFLTWNGKPWLPVMGEFHYTRVPAAEWESEILKMKSAGVSIIATYVIWIHHEEMEGQFDWTGDRDLHKFLELCRKHGMYVYPRIGPWAHGEVRNGGFPDWLLLKTRATRRNDPVYLSYVRRFYLQLAAQMKGELWKDGGPVIGVQIENEYAQRGSGTGEEHILELKKLALEAGLDVPMYSVTGWDDTVVPHGEVVAVFGGYPDAPWDRSLSKLPPQEVYAFRFGSRATGNMGAIGLSQSTQPELETYDFPFMTAEMGGGVQDTYHRRPVIHPDDVAAMIPVMLGSGVNLYGSYMFQGGENPDGKLTTLQESQATHYPTDVPVKSYDFQAPLGEFGDERPTLRKLKIFDYFLQDFGAQLAPMQVYAPSVVPAGPQDFTVPRIAVRTDGKGGFVFLNNYVRGSVMPQRSGFQVKVKLPGGNTLKLPETPVTIPDGAYGIWPFGIHLGPITLRYATAQIFTTTSSGNESTYYFVETKGVPAEFVFQDDGVTRFSSPGKSRKGEDGTLQINGLAASLEDAITFATPANGHIHVVLLSQQQAENAWKLEQTHTVHLLFTTAQFYAKEHTAALESIDAPTFRFQIRPRLAIRVKSERVQARARGNATTFTADLPAASPHVTVTQIAQPAKVHPVSFGPASAGYVHGVAMAPEDSEFTRGARWKISLSPSDWQGVAGLWLDIQYDGDIARLVSGGKLLADNFYNGEAWRIRLNRFREAIARDGLELEILPRRADAPIFLEHPDATGDMQIVQLKSITLHPEYQIQVGFRSEP